LVLGNFTNVALSVVISSGFTGLLLLWTSQSSPLPIRVVTARIT
jgi:hypothetical protein